VAQNSPEKKFNILKTNKDLRIKFSNVRLLTCIMHCTAHTLLGTTMCWFLQLVSWVGPYGT